MEQKSIQIIGGGVFGTVIKILDNIDSQKYVAHKIVPQRYFGWYDATTRTYVCLHDKDPRHPEVVEWKTHIKLFDVFKNKNVKHICEPITSFRCNESKFVDFMKFLHQFKIYPNVKDLRVNSFEFVSGGTLYEFLKYQHCEQEEVIRMIAQVVMALIQIQYKYPTFRHNDLHIRNILLRHTETPSDYTFGVLKFEIPKTKYTIVITDFDSAEIKPIITNFSMSLRYGPSFDSLRYHDLHKMFNYVKALTTNLPKFNDFLDLKLLLEFVVPPFLFGEEVIYGDVQIVKNFGIVLTSSELLKIFEHEKFNVQMVYPEMLIFHRIFKKYGVSIGRV
jgi:serine/threonine protein kinase